MLTAEVGLSRGSRNGKIKITPDIPRSHDFLGYCLLSVKIRPQLVQAPIVHRLGDMGRTDFRAAGQIGDRTGHAQNSIHCPS